MMMQPAMVNPYTSAAKTAEIMSRYRPIAPKPMDGGAAGGDGGGGGVGGMSEKIQQSPYLRNLWPKLQARPTRTRKRGGRMIGVSVTPSAFKRTSPPQAVGSRGVTAAFLGLSPPPQFYAVSNGWLCSRFLAAGAVEKMISPPSKAAMGSLVTLPLLPSSAASLERCSGGETGIDLKSMVEMTPDEKDLTLQLRGPAESSGSGNVISPRPIRPIGSCITLTSLTSVNAIPVTSFTSLTSVNANPVTCFNSLTPLTTLASLKTAAEVEAEIEADELPAIVTDSRNRVRLTNSAYNKMVGQPECMWLGTMSGGRGGGGRIGGVVVIKAAAETTAAQHNAGFNGRVTIEWGSKGTKKAAIDACCEVVRLRCVSKDYLFAWRFQLAQ